MMQSTKEAMMKDEELYSAESVKKAQDFIDGMKESKGELWSIIVHEVAMFRAIINEARQKPGVDKQLLDRIVALAALHTSALVKHAGYDNREHEIMADTDTLLDIAVSGIDEAIQARKAAAETTPNGETLH